MIKLIKVELTVTQYKLLENTLKGYIDVNHEVLEDQDLKDLNELLHVVSPSAYWEI